MTDLLCIVSINSNTLKLHAKFSLNAWLHMNFFGFQEEQNLKIVNNFCLHLNIYQFFTSTSGTTVAANYKNFFIHGKF